MRGDDAFSSSSSLLLLFFFYSRDLPLLLICKPRARIFRRTVSKHPNRLLFACKTRRRCPTPAIVPINHGKIIFFFLNCMQNFFITFLRVYLFESLQYFLSLTEMSEEKMQCSRNQRWIIVHRQVKQYTQKCTSSLAVEIQSSAFLA